LILGIEKQGVAVLELEPLVKIGGGAVGKPTLHAAEGRPGIVLQDGRSAGDQLVANGFLVVAILGIEANKGIKGRPFLIRLSRYDRGHTFDHADPWGLGNRLLQQARQSYTANRSGWALTVSQPSQPPFRKFVVKPTDWRSPSERLVQRR
jgi:hypothetical protein